MTIPESEDKEAATWEGIATDYDSSFVIDLIQELHSACSCHSYIYKHNSPEE
jgi:hypothetical protein